MSSTALTPVDVDPPLPNPFPDLTYQLTVYIRRHGLYPRRYLSAHTNKGQCRTDEADLGATEEQWKLYTHSTRTIALQSCYDFWLTARPGSRYFEVAAESTTVGPLQLWYVDRTSCPAGAFRLRRSCDGPANPLFIMDLTKDRLDLDPSHTAHPDRAYCQDNRAMNIPYQLWEGGPVTDDMVQKSKWNWLIPKLPSIPINAQVNIKA